MGGGIVEPTGFIEHASIGNEGIAIEDNWFLDDPIVWDKVLDTLDKIKDTPLGTVLTSMVTLQEYERKKTIDYKNSGLYQWHGDSDGDNLGLIDTVLGHYSVKGATLNMLVDVSTGEVLEEWHEEF